MRIIQNPYRGSTLPSGIGYIQPDFIANSSEVLSLLSYCPSYSETPLTKSEPIARSLEIDSIHIKDERQRMGLGSFKALGAANVIAQDAFVLAGSKLDDTTLLGKTYVAASAGNHGLSVATGARVFGAEAVIYLAETVPHSFHQRLEALGARVVVEGADYAESMDAAAQAAKQNDWRLLSDSTWAGYDGGVGVMHGYLALAHEITDQIDEVPTHVFVQAGVGGLAAALSRYFRNAWGDQFQLCVVEPTDAPAILESILAAAPVITEGRASIMGRLDCKEPSHVALKTLAADANYFLTITDEHAVNSIEKLDAHGLSTSPSGGAGFAGLDYARTLGQCKLTQNSKALVVLSEGPVSG